MPTGKYYVLMIAIDYYISPDFASLKNPILDAQHFIEVLGERYDIGFPDTTNLSNLRVTDPRYQSDTAQPIWVYDSTQFKCLYNEAATKGNIRAHIAKVAAEIGPNDLFLVYYAGHGEVDNDIGYMMASNAQKDLDQTGWLDYEQLYIPFTNYTKNSKCRDLLLILDCCHAGAATLGNQGVNDEGRFSRKVVMSCGNNRLAADGKAGEGSPFANALVDALRKNKGTLLDCTQILPGINAVVGPQTMGEQSVTYTALPVEQNGQGDFVFKLKSDIVAALPAQELAGSFIRHLNFDDQKTSFKKHFKAIEKGDLHILSTSAYDYDVQQLLRTVLFDFTQTYASINLNPGDPILIWPNTLPDGGFWEALQRSLNTGESSKDLMVKHIVDRMQVTEAFVKKPFVVAIGFESGMPEIAKELLTFAAEFMEMLFKEKSKREHKIFAKFFLMLSELTPGETHFSLKDAFVLPDQTSFGITTIDQVQKDHVDKYVFEAWHTEASKQLGPKMPTLTGTELFENDDHCYDVLSFIYTIADKLQIAKEEVIHNLGIIKS